MIQLLPAYADGAFATWAQNLVSLRELRLEYAIWIRNGSPLGCGSAMPFESTQKGMQRGGYRCPYGQTAAFRVFPEKFYGSWRKL
jgi:hypothetical protein